jgi:hypothetical protein
LMPVSWVLIRNKTKWLVLPSAGLLLTVEIVYHRRYIRLEHSPLRIATESPASFDLVWTALLVATVLLGLAALPKWQSFLGLFLVCIVIALRANAP